MMYNWKAEAEAQQRRAERAEERAEKWWRVAVNTDKEKEQAECERDEAREDTAEARRTARRVWDYMEDRQQAGFSDFHPVPDWLTETEER